MSQSRTHSALESVANVAIGFGIALAAQVLIMGALQIEITFEQNVLVTVFFTFISLARSYVLRRLFNRWHARGIE